MKNYIVLLLTISSIMILSFGGKFDIKEDLTVQIEINILGFTIILMSVICIQYTFKNSENNPRSPIEIIEQVLQPQIPHISQIIDQQEDAKLQQGCKTYAQKNNPSESSFKQDEDFQSSEVMTPVKQITHRKSSLRSDDRNLSLIGDSASNMDDLDFNFKKQRTMSLHLPSDLVDEPLQKRKVSFNENINTVHRYRKNSRKEQKNYTLGQQELNQIKRKVSLEVDSNQENLD